MTRSISGANGLPRGFPKMRPDLPMAGGSLASSRAGADTLRTRANERTLGDVIATPDVGIKKALAQLGRSKGGAGRILFTPGVWNLAEDVTISRDGVELVALSPGRTIFRRSGREPTDSLIQFTGANTLISGITIDDAEDGVGIELAGTNNQIRNCVFSDCYLAVTATNGSAPYVSDVVIQSCRSVPIVVGPLTITAALQFSDTSGAYVSGFRSLVSGYDIWYDATTTDSTVFGNVLPGGQVIYTIASNVVEAANVATVRAL